ncbi:helix-turn-helix domain-containing protein [Herbaspirillum sp. SJZ107]|uniref:AraC family transcriptional regulator n=1 Tax=Herbaspirillum sp. SJZ107 TaxID=2572881 RepID=UPI0011510F7E|nr:helix-turn-helix domain-containing protein [Herbaspirillum sp. SJZ107]TQK02716.1 AraC family transcriptional regulator [Herbaspirillum sp. SJZ107]
MTTPATVPDRAKGVVAPALAGRMFRMERYLPPPDLAPFIEHVWIVEWDLRGQPPFVQRTLPYPSVHVVFDRVRSGVFGVVTGAFDYTLQAAGKLCGLKFRPGAFRAFLGRPLHTISDRVLPLSSVFGWDDAAALDAVLAAPDDMAMIDAAGTLLRARLPAADPQVERIGAILRTAESTPGLTRVEALAAAAGMGVRSLQQLFSEYVGVSPKWVIRRYRLHEAADRLAQGGDLDLSALALDLGYVDQAHFTSDFRRLVGQAPGRYRDDAQAVSAPPPDRTADSRSSPAHSRTDPSAPPP